MSADPNHVTMVDSVKVYTKAKEAFGWPDDDETASTESVKQQTTSGGSGSSDMCASSDRDVTTSHELSTPLNSLGRYVIVIV